MWRKIGFNSFQKRLIRKKNRGLYHLVLGRILKLAFNCNFILAQIKSVEYYTKVQSFKTQ